MMITPSYVIPALHGFLSEKNIAFLQHTSLWCQSVPSSYAPSCMSVLLVVGNAQLRLCPFVRTNNDGDNNINYSHAAAAAAVFAP